MKLTREHIPLAFSSDNDCEGCEIMESPSKNGGAASQFCDRNEGTSAKPQLSQENKNISPFCKDCKPINPTLLPTSFRIFIYRAGFTWLCSKPMTCEHSIVLGGAIASCRVRTAQLNEAEAQLGYI
jgi:hypothetical protein